MARRSGQIIKRGERKWQIRWYDAASRKSPSKTVHGTKHDADKVLRGILRSRDLGEYVEPNKRTLNALLDSWLHTQSKAVSGRTLANMRCIVGKHVRPALGELQLQRVTPLNIQTMIDSMSERARRPLSPRTHQLALRYLSQALRHAVRLNLLPRNPAEGTTLPKRADGDASAGKQNERRSLTRDELRAFLRASRGTAWEALWQLMATTGCRPGEALALTWRDLTSDRVTFCKAVTQDERARLVVGPIKTRETRRIPLPKQVLDALAAHRGTQREHILRQGAAYDRTRNLVFGNAVGHLVNEGNLRERHFKPLLRESGVKLQRGDGPYLLRHTVVTQLLLAGEPAQAVAERVGDTVATIMAHYAHAVPGLQVQATKTITALVFG